MNSLIQPLARWHQTLSAFLNIAESADVSFSPTEVAYASSTQVTFVAVGLGAGNGTHTILCSFGGYAMDSQLPVPTTKVVPLDP